MTVRAVESALACGAGEVLVSEDASGEDISALRRFSDPRYRFVEQPTNLGLWRNHLALLRLTERRWIKFLQTDDGMAPDCLQTMCAAVGPETTLVSMLPVYLDLDTGKTEHRYEMSEPLRWPAGEYVDRMAQVGNEPGRPSYTLCRRDVLLETEEAWRNDMSCDLAANVIAASKGEVVLLPPGGVTCGSHPGRDGLNQSFDLLASRLVNTLKFLARQPDPRIRRFLSVYGTVETLGIMRVFVGKCRRGHRPPLSQLTKHITTLLRTIGIRQMCRHAAATRIYYRYKYTQQTPIKIQKQPPAPRHLRPSA